MKITNFHLGFFDLEVSTKEVATFALAFCPINDSAINTVRPINNIHKRYIITKAPPPYSPVIYGNFHIFPKPTAEPAAARINPSLENLFNLRLLFQDKNKLYKNNINM